MVRPLGLVNPFIASPRYEDFGERVAGRSRVLKVLVAVSIVFWMLVTVPTSPCRSDTDVARSTANGSRVYEIGGVDFTNFMATLSPFKSTSQQEMMTIWPCMSTLLTYNKDEKLIGDIAQSWSMSADGLTWCFKMEPNIFFTDPTSPLTMVHKLTWVDIQYTYFQVQNHTNNLQNYFRAADQPIINRIWGDAATNWVNISLNFAYAPFVRALTETPIIPKYYWQPHENAQGDATAWTGALPIGSGPFYYGLPGLPTAGEVVLLRNPIWFQEADRGWQVHVDQLRYRAEFDSATGWADLKLGIIDLLMEVSPPIYINDLPSEPMILGWAQSTGFVYEYNLCQMTDAMRSSLGSPYISGSNSQLLQDPIVKRAMAMAVDKQAFVDQILLGLGSPADSLVPEVSPWHYSPQNQVSFDITGANSLLQSNGYVDIDADGVRECTANSPAVVNGLATEGAKLIFRFETLNYATEWVDGAILIRDWAAQIGVRLDLVIKSISQLHYDWMYANYDTWLWNWEFSPNSDPSTDIMSLLTTMEIGKWQDLYWSNATYDSVYNMSLVEMDPIARRELTNQLQQMAYDNMGCQLVAYKKSLYAANCSTWDASSYVGCGTKWTLTPESGYPWLYMQLSPVDNPAPVVTPGSSVYNVYAGAPYIFSGTASDSSPLQFQWFWGDGTSSGWLPTTSATHIYSEGGWYTAYFAAREIGEDAFSSWAKVIVIVTNFEDSPPHDLSFTYQPLLPKALEPVDFAGTATDDDGDPLTFTWNFGDSTTGNGQSPTHTYSSAGSYLVTMSVWDNQPGSAPVSYSVQVTVGLPNAPPSLSVPDHWVAVWKVDTVFAVSASDVDDDPLRYTWDWGDGQISVTSTPLATHAYNRKQVYTLTVFADDLTGVSGHNISGSCAVSVSGTPSPPEITGFGATPLIAEAGVPISYTGSAVDNDGMWLRFTFDFGDGTYEVRDSMPLAPGETETFTVSHSYATPGDKVANLYVMDHTLNNVSATPLSVTIVPPHVPIVSPLSPVTALTGQSLVITADAFDPYCPVLRYTWDFGDGSALKVGNPVSYTYSIPGDYTYTVYVDDLIGHNVSASANATVGFGLLLYTGWNFISIPLISNCTARTLGLSTGDQVVRWNSSTRTYDKIYIVGFSPPTFDFPLIMSYGYWVYSTSDKVVPIYGEVPTTDMSRYIQVPAGGGWASIGLSIWHTIGELGAADLQFMFDPPTLTLAVRWKTYPYELYETYVVGLPMNDFPLKNGEGYWVYLSGSSLFTYTW